MEAAPAPPEAGQGDKSFGWLERALRGDAGAPTGKPTSGRFDPSPQAADAPPPPRPAEPGEVPPDLTPPQTQAMEGKPEGAAVETASASEGGAKPEEIDAAEGRGPERTRRAACGRKRARAGKGDSRAAARGAAAQDRAQV